MDELNRVCFFLQETAHQGSNKAARVAARLPCQRQTSAGSFLAALQAIPHTNPGIPPIKANDLMSLNSQELGLAKGLPSLRHPMAKQLQIANVQLFKNVLKIGKADTEANTGSFYLSVSGGREKLMPNSWAELGACYRVRQVRTSALGRWGAVIVIPCSINSRPVNCCSMPLSRLRTICRAVAPRPRN